jgi:hypothetical protein
MRPRYLRRTVVIAAAAFTAAAAVTVIAQVSTGTYELWWRTTSGGGAATGGPYALQAAIGQPLSARSTGGDYAVGAGFLGGSGPDRFYRFLPQIARDGTD